MGEDTVEWEKSLSLGDTTAKGKINTYSSCA